MYKVIAAGTVGLADSQEDVRTSLEEALNQEAKNGFKIVAATSEMVILEKAGRKPGRPKKETTEPESEE